MLKSVSSFRTPKQTGADQPSQGKNEIKEHELLEILALKVNV